MNESILPPKDRRDQYQIRSVRLPDAIWEELSAIARASRDYSRNDVIELFLERGIATWKREQEAKAGT